MSFFWTSYSSKNPEKNISRFPQKNIKQKQFSTLIIIVNNNNYKINININNIKVFEHQINILECFLNDHVTLNDAENSAFHHRNKLHFKIY